MNKRVTQVVILAGGLGTRLKPFTNTAPNLFWNGNKS